MPAPKPPFRRFLESYSVDPVTGCWNWTKYGDGERYGVIKVFGRLISAHRYSYELHKGPIADGLHVLHSCDNKQCVNPDHLSLGTQADNSREASERGLLPHGVTHHQAQPVLVLGRPYPSLNAADQALRLGRGTVRYWLRTGSTKARPITREEYKRYA